MAFDQVEERVHCDDPAAILREQAVSPRAWTPDSLTADVPRIFYDMTREAKNEIVDALRRIKMRGLHPQNVEQQDFRVPSFARDVPMLRDHLDRGCGFVVLRGLDVEVLTEDQALIVYWGARQLPGPGHAPGSERGPNRFRLRQGGRRKIQKCRSRWEDRRRGLGPVSGHRHQQILHATHRQCLFEPAAT